MKTIFLFGLRRSGNHFIISTLSQLFSNYVHINNANLSYEEYIKYKEIPITKKTSNSDYSGFKNTECVIISMENKEINFDELSKFRNISNVFSIILLRNPYNNLSSVWKVYENQGIRNRQKRTIRTRDLWIKYAHIFLDNNCKLIKILYDQFCINKKYRNNIFNKISPQTSISIDINKKIKYSTSSYKIKKNSKRVFGDLCDCVYKDDEQFKEFFSNTDIHNLWHMIVLDFTK